MLPIDPSDRPGSSLPGGPPPGPPEGTPHAQPLPADPLAAQPLIDIVPPAATAHGNTIIRPGTTIIRPGAVAWGGPPDARDGGYSSCEAVERALAAVVRNPAELPGLLTELAPSRLWVPLPHRPFTDGTAVRLPLIRYQDADFVPCFTSVQRLNAWAGRAEAAALDPVTGAELPGTGPAGPGQAHRAGERRGPAAGTGSERATRGWCRTWCCPPSAWPGGCRPASASRSTPTAPPACRFPRVRALPGPAHRACHPRAARQRSAWRPGDRAPRPVHRRPVPHRAPARRAVGAARRDTGRAARAPLRLPGLPRLAVRPRPGRGPADLRPARRPVERAGPGRRRRRIEDATAAVALRVPFPVDLIFPGEAPPDAIDTWIADNTRPFYHRD